MLIIQPKPALKWLNHSNKGTGSVSVCIKLASVHKEPSCASCKHVCVPDLKTLSNVLRAVYCTYPVPLHAHTHFLATVRPALVLHRVRGQTLATPLFLTSLRLTQDLGHTLLVYIVQTLIGTCTQMLARQQSMPIQWSWLKQRLSTCASSNQIIIKAGDVYHMLLGTLADTNTSHLTPAVRSVGIRPSKWLTVADTQSVGSHFKLD